jgi:hypothetical protein
MDNTDTELLRRFLQSLLTENPITRRFIDKWSSVPGLYEVVKANPRAFNLFGLEVTVPAYNEVRINKPDRYTFCISPLGKLS